MQSYTFGSAEGMNALHKALPEKYPMELNRSDMDMLIKALHVAWNEGEPVDVSDWAGGFLSSIGQTVGVEWV